MTMKMRTRREEKQAERRVGWINGNTQEGKKVKETER
jgi:hypothetical protein